MKHLPLSEDVIMDPTLPAELFQSYARLLFRAWDGQHLHAVTLAFEDLRALWGSHQGALSGATTFRYLRGLTARCLIAHTTGRDGRYWITFPKAATDLTLKNESILSDLRANSPSAELALKNDSDGQSEKSFNIKNDSQSTLIEAATSGAAGEIHATLKNDSQIGSCSSSLKNQILLPEASANLKNESDSPDQMESRLVQALCTVFRSPRTLATRAVRAALARGWTEELIVTEMGNWKLFLGQPDSKGIRQPWIFIPVQIENGSLCPVQPAAIEPLTPPSDGLADESAAECGPTGNPALDAPWNGCDQSPRQIWQAARDRLQLELNKNVYDTWVRGIVVLPPEAGTLVLGVTHAYAKDWLENRLLETIRRTLSGVVGHSVETRLTLVTVNNGTPAGQPGGVSHTDVHNMPASVRAELASND